MKNKTWFFSILIFLLSAAGSVMANDVEIVEAVLLKTSSNKWSVNVTLKHGDTGWDHYADNWRVVDVDGKVLGNRVLHHPHVGEQPFTRGLAAVSISEEIKMVYIEAHDKVHGWTTDRLMIDVTKDVEGVLRVRP